MVIVFNSSLSHRHEGDFVAVLICTSLMSNDAEHHFIGLFAIPASSWYFFKSLGPFLCYFFLMFNFECSLYILDTSTLVRCVICKYFLQVYGLCFHSFFLKFYFIFKLYKIVFVLPNIKMNLSQVYICSFLIL